MPGLISWVAGISVVVVGAAVLMQQLVGDGGLQMLLGDLRDNKGYGTLKMYCYESVRTQDPAVPVADCFTVDPSTGTFSRVFPLDAATTNGGYEVLPGHVIPGLWDGHGHLLQYGEFLHSVDLFGSRSVAEVRSRLEAYLDREGNEAVGGDAEWLRGVGWDQMALGKMPTADDLSASPRLSQLFIMLDRVDVHCIWVSPAILSLLPSPIPDVPGGDVIRDPPGEGVLCDNAMDMVLALWPRPGKEKKKAFIRSAMRELNKVGLVGMHDAGVVPRDLKMMREIASEAEVEARDKDADEGDWTVRVYAMAECGARNTFCSSDMASLFLPDAAPLASHPSSPSSGLLTVRSVKLFADGALGSWGSAMLEPYSDRPDTTGSMLLPPDRLTAVAKEWALAGFQVNIHAIGDAANRAAVTALEAAISAANAAREGKPDGAVVDIRHRIEHAQIVHPSDQLRIAALAGAVLPSIQPTHATSDMAYAEARLGAERTAREAYRMRSLLEPRRRANESTLPDHHLGLGLSHVVLGSDFPVEPPDPLQGVYAAVTRRSPHTGLGRTPGSRGDEKAPTKEGWFVREQGLSLDQALDGFTTGPAWGAYMEGRAGLIQEGAWADWVVLRSRWDDYAEDDAHGLERLRGGTEVLETWVGGRRVYKREE